MDNSKDLWNNAAQSYAQSQEESEFANVNKKIVVNRFKKLNGEKLLDLGCGYGFYTDYFKNIGADAIGIDGSGNMIDIAKENYKGCDFEVVDITETLPFHDSCFDIVFCNQVLMDIEDIEPLFSEINRVMKKGGIFYYSIVHPAFYDSKWIQNENGFNESKTMKSYIQPYCLTNHFWGKTKHFHRPLSYYLNLAIKHSFKLKDIEEPQSYDGIIKNKDLPLFLFAEYIKE